MRDGAAETANPRDTGPVDANSPFSVVMGTPHGETLNSIFGWDAEHFIAVGTSQVSYVYSGGLFTRLGGSSSGNDLNAVWGASPTDVYAVGTSAGGGGFVQHYDGSGWVTVFEAPTGLYGIWGAASDQLVIAVGEGGVLYGYYPSSTWQMIATVPFNPDAPDAAMTKNSPLLTAITGRNIGDFTVTSNGDRFFHWEPEAGGLAYYDPMLPPTTNFTAAWQVPGALETSVYIGSNYYGLYWFTAPDIATDASILGNGNAGYHFTQLYLDSKTPGAEGLTINGIWANPTKAVAVGGNGLILVYDIATDTTTVVPGPSDTKQSLGGVWGSSPTDVWIVGWSELILHGSVE
jgi:hypothetical protein